MPIAGTRVRVSIVAVALAGAGLALPAAAQVAVEAALQTDYRVRGYSVSDGEPTASVSLTYDDPSGFYLGGSAIGTVRDGEPELLGIQGGAGYAVRLTPTLSIDGGSRRRSTSTATAPAATTITPRSTSAWRYPM